MKTHKRGMSMVLKSIIVIFLIIQEIYEFGLTKIRDAYRKRPLPKEVSDIYDEKRYQEFISYKSEYKRLLNKSDLISIVFSLFLIFSPFFQWMEGFHNVYVTLFVTLVITDVVEGIVSYFVENYATFVIEEKYGKNKKTRKEFNKDFFLDTVLDFVSTCVLYGILVFICENILNWTNHFQISYLQSFLFVMAIVVVIGIVVFIFAILSVAVMFKQYTFVDLEDQELLDKINEMRKGVKKKIKGIKVYDESKKSTSKNAFVLGIPFYRIIGIADNFLNENSKRELYGVLAHEIGHLKHKKNIWNYLKYSMMVLFVLCLIWLIPNGLLVQKLAAYVNEQFNLQASCYYLYFMLIGLVLSPVSFLVTIYNNYVTRKEEYEADQNAVKEGYGQDLIHLFKDLSRDELVDVNPSPIIEFLEYDHPGMYRRILGLQQKK